MEVLRLKSKNTKNTPKGKDTHINVMIFDNIESIPKKFKISKKAIKNIIMSLSAVILITTLLLSFLTNRYIVMSKDAKTLHELRQETSKQRIKIEEFVKMIRDFEMRLVKLDSFDKKLRVITSTGKTDGANSDQISVGGPDETTNNNIIQNDSGIGLERLFNELEHLKVNADRQILSFNELDTYIKEKADLLSSAPTIWPTKGWLTSEFGYRTSPFTNLKEPHEGLDIATNQGTPIIAPADGIVIRDGIATGYGKIIAIDHGYGIITRYAHNSKHYVTVGTKVKRGDIIAAVGNTGRSTGSHVHYEILLNGIPVDPLRYIVE